MQDGQGLTPSVTDRLLAGDARAATTLAIGGENQWVELNDEPPTASKFMKDLVAFANSGGGVLIVGVGDSGQTIGWQRSDSEAAARKMREMADAVVPNLAHVREGQVDDKWLAWVVVEPANEPLVTADGAYWRRASNRILRSSRVFINYVPEDDSLANLISDALAQAAIPTVSPVKNRGGGWSWTRQVLAELVRTNDVVLQLWTANSSDQNFNEGELRIDLEKRGATLIPVAVGDEVNEERDYRVVKITDPISAEAVNKLIDEVTATSRIDFSALTPQVFESLVSDLFVMLGFRIYRSPSSADLGFDIKATHARPDPFGRLETETWLVETKFYQHSRVRIENIRSIIGAISLEPADTRGALITNSQISSVVQDYLTKLEKRTQARLRVIDGVELKRLIANFPPLVEKYFIDPSRSREPSGNDS